MSFVIESAKHYKVRLSLGAVTKLVIVSKTPNGTRSQINDRAHIRRAIRELAMNCN